MANSSGMRKSMSVPGLQSLGLQLPVMNKNYARACTLAYRQNTAVDLLSRDVGEIPEKGQTIAHLCKKPSWRLSVTEPVRLPQADPVPRNMKWPRASPAWLKHDKQVLRFYAFFQETVVERWDENSRYRNAVIMYYMEDGTMQITEPKVENSGISQGAFLKRHHVPRPDGQGFVGPDDFKVGEEITLYARTYHITGADAFTRWFFQENGLEIADDEPLVQDQWQKSYTFQKIAEKGGLPAPRCAIEAKQLNMFMIGQPPTERRLVQFLENDRKVLRFQGYWDDDTQYGARIYFTVHYYLANDTMEVNEAHMRNSGRWDTPVFYKRGPMYKENTTNVYPGMLEPDKVKYMPQDLLVGGSMLVYGRKVYLYSCDEFTRKFYLGHLGIDQAENTIDVSQPKQRHQKLKPPPHNGVGKEEDSLINCLMIQPKPHKQDLAKMMRLTGEVLRFECRMINGEPEDENRRFIVGYFLADDHCAVWEVAVRNSGHMAGKFQEKARYKNPETKAYFKLSEFAVGSILTLAAQPFLLTKADERTLAFMEANCMEYDLPFADAGFVASKLPALANEPEMQAGIDPETLKELAAQVGVSLIDHEIITLLRNLSVEGEDGKPLINGPAILDFLGS